MSNYRLEDRPRSQMFRLQLPLNQGISGQPAIFKKWQCPPSHWISLNFLPFPTMKYPP